MRLVLRLALSLFVPLALLPLTAGPALAQTVYAKQDACLSNGTACTGGSKLAAVACNAAPGSRWTGWIAVPAYRNVVLDVDFVDANASAASLDVRCETSRTSVTAADAGRDLPIITGTSAGGVSTIMQSGYSWVSTTGGAPGSSGFPLYIQNIPAPFIECLFTCGAGGAAADNFTVFARGITP